MVGQFVEGSVVKKAAGLQVNVSDSREFSFDIDLCKPVWHCLHYEHLYQ